MSASSYPPILLLVLTDRDDPHRVSVPFDSFLRFSDDVAVGLDEMVHRWRHCAAPVARWGAIHRGTWAGPERPAER